MLELLKKLYISLDEDNVIRIIPRCFASGLKRDEIFSAINAAMDEIGNMYHDGVYTLSDLMMAGIIYGKIMKYPEFDFSCDTRSPAYIGSILIGTIESDIHDLGKSIFKSAASASGFKIVDAGVDVSPAVFCDYVKKYKPDILAISAILTTTVPYMQKVINNLAEENLRSGLKIIIGGNMISGDMCELVGADDFAANVFDGIEICKKWMNKDAN